MYKTKGIKSFREAAAPLIHITQELLEGVNEKDLIRRYHRYPIAPGITIQQHLRELQAGGCLIRKGAKLIMKAECNPLKIFQAA